MTKDADYGRAFYVGICPRVLNAKAVGMIELSGAASVLAVIVVLIVLLRLFSIEKRVAALSRLDAKLDLLLKQAGIEYDPYKDLSRQVTEALQRGEKIQAIKHYREATGVGLKEAKDFIEEVQRRAGIGA